MQLRNVHPRVLVKIYFVYLFAYCFWIFFLASAKNWSSSNLVIFKSTIQKCIYLLQFAIFFVMKASNVDIKGIKTTSILTSILFLQSYTKSISSSWILMIRWLGYGKWQEQKIQSNKRLRRMGEVTKYALFG